MDKKTITFFMLVTNRDAYLATYAIKSFRKLIPLLKQYDWKLIVYANCLTDRIRNELFSKWKVIGKRFANGGGGYIEIINNLEFVDINELVPGKAVESDDGCKSQIIGRMEHYNVLWTNHFRNFQTDYWVTVDADFEILNGDFVKDAFEKLEKNENMVVFSSNSSETKEVYDSYSDENIVLMKRYHTWFCVYKKKAQCCRTSHFYYQDVINGKRYAYDSAAKFQTDLRTQFGFEMGVSEANYHRSFIHHGAFSNNASLDTTIKVFLFRKIALLAHKGFWGTDSVVDKAIRFFFERARRRLYAASQNERGKYQHYSKLDK